MIAEDFHGGLSVGVVGRFKLQVRDACGRRCEKGREISQPVARPLALPRRTDAFKESPNSADQIAQCEVTVGYQTLHLEREEGREGGGIVVDRGIWVPKARACQARRNELGGGGKGRKEGGRKQAREGGRMSVVSHRRNWLADNCCLQRANKRDTDRKSEV